MAERIKRGLPERAVVVDANHILERQLIPTLKGVRDAVNAMAPSGTVTIEETDLHVDVIFDTPEADDDYLVDLAVIGEDGTPPTSARRVWSPRQDIFGFRVQVQFRPGTGNSVTVKWSIRR